MTKRSISDFFAPKKAARTRSGGGDDAKTAAPMSPHRKPPAIDPATAARIAEKKEAARRRRLELVRTGTVPASHVGGAAQNFVPPIPASWEDALGAERKKPYFRNLEKFLAGERAKGKKIFPPADEIFAALDMCAFNDVRAVIIGQDPYHGVGQGHGLAFSVQRGVKTPPSLRNMVAEAMDGGFMTEKPAHGNLSHWTSQGVLLLNNVLTVEAHKADSHKKKGWEDFTAAVVRALNKREGPGIVFLLWGKPAQTKGAAVDRRRHHVITTSHPSPLGYTKTAAPFKGSKCFNTANEWLVESGRPAIDWSLGK